MKNKKHITINTKKVGLFLKNLNEAERIYLGHIFNLSNSIRRLIKKFELTKKDVCTHYEIKPNRYNDFISGNWNYDLKIMAKTNALFIKLETEALEDETPVQMVFDKERCEKKKQQEKGKDKLNKGEEVEKK